MITERIFIRRADLIAMTAYLNLDREHVQLAHYRGVMRWQHELLRRELVCVGVGV